MKPTNSPELNEDSWLPCARHGWTTTKSALARKLFGQFWAMRDGSPGRYGTPGNEESASCRFQVPLVGSNPTLTAKSFIINLFNVTFQPVFYAARSPFLALTY